MTPRVLVVDDSLTVRMDIQEGFEQAGFEVALAEDLASARDLATEEFQLVVLDMKLPDGEGTELLKELREDPTTGSVPVIFLSSRREVEDRIKGIRAGAQDYAGKPYDRDYLVARGRELVALPDTAERGTILVIEDSATFRATLRESFELAGYRVIESSTGEGGLRRAASERPDAILVDGMLPDLDGAAVVQRMRLDIGLRDIPCILLTASLGNRQELEALAAGADAYLRKDQGMDVLLARVTAILESGGASSQARERPSVFGPKRILVVDDSETHLETLSRSLTANGYDVVLARSGTEALDHLSVQVVDCILLDLVMPGMSGHETCRRLKKSPAWRHIPVLMLTASDDRESMIEGINAGSDDFISKSSDFEVILARMRAQLRRKQFELDARRSRDALHQKELDASKRLQEILQERARDLEMANRHKSEFLANMSHELRTPLNSILILSKLLTRNRHGNLDDEQVKWASTIHDSGSDLLDLINDVLDLARVESGRMEMESQVCDLREMVSRLERSFQCLATERGISFATEIDPRCPDALVTDSRRLEQALKNLLSNAFKFTESGGVSLRIRLATADENRMTGHALAFEVEDTGIGIEPEKLSAVFEAFEQEDGTTSRRFGGTGLGLSISRNLIELMGGIIKARSTKSEGSVFTIVLPLGSGSREPEETKASPPGGSDAPADPWADVDLSCSTVLIVDDEPRNLYAIREALDRYGLEILVAGDGREALRTLAARRDIDVVLLDMMMPRMDGYECLQRIRSDARSRDLAVIAVTARAMSGDRDRCLAAGATDYVAKPVDMDQLSEKLAAALPHCTLDD